MSHRRNPNSGSELLRTRSVEIGTTQRPVRSITALRLLQRHTLGMETLVEGTYKAYEVIRTLADGQTVQVGTFQKLSEARGLIAALSEYWPGGYSIVPSSKEKRAA